MLSKSFEVDDLVWAKMKGYCAWPAKIVKPPADTTPSIKKAQHYVFFFGSKNFAWIPDESIEHHSESLVEQAKKGKKKTSQFLAAINTILEESKSTVKKLKPAKEKSEEETPVKPKHQVLPAKTPEASVKKTPAKKAKTPAEKPLTQRKLPQKRQIDTKVDGTPSPKMPKSDHIMPSYNGSVNVSRTVAVIKPYDEDSISTSRSDCVMEKTIIPSFVPKIKREAVKPTQKKLGVIGLGLIGQNIVKNLLRTGHKVTVWNRTAEKCKDSVRAGAKQCSSVADLFSSCDITFSCVSDPEVAKHIVFGDNGILKGLDGCQSGSKGYVEMSSIDPTTSEEISEAITSRGGRYLEAPVCGSKKLAEEGSLLLLGSGDRTLFNECETCFFAVSKSVYYLGCNVGSSSKMNLVLNMLMGTVYAALGEVLSLIERHKLSTTNFLEILALGSLGCPALLEKGEAMISGAFETNTALKHMQKDLRLCLKMGSQYDQPMHLAAAANEVFKHAKFLNFSDCDVSAVIEGTRK